MTRKLSMEGALWAGELANPAHAKMVEIAAHLGLAGGAYPNDLAVHDKAFVEGLPPGTEFLWLPYPDGSHVIPPRGLAAMRVELVRQIRAGYPAVQAFVVRTESPGRNAALRRVDMEQALQFAARPISQRVVVVYRDRHGKEYETSTDLLPEREARRVADDFLTRGMAPMSGDPIARIHLQPGKGDPA